MEPWKTEIAYSSETETLIRGYDLESLIKNRTFTEMIYLILKGELPSKSQTTVMNAMLVAAAEHGIAPPSATSARMVASGGAAFNASVAAGILALGDYHGGAIEGCAKLLQESQDKSAEEIVEEFRSQGKRIPGFGHKIYSEDPRTVALILLAKKEKILGKCVKKALEIEKELEKATGKKLCLNIDGIIAALLSDMDFDWRLSNGFFVIARAPGLVAHVYEEKTKEKPFRRLEEGKDYEYVGKKKRD
ncbi:MAG: citryl-CoA lyase [Nanoarchaeota archaeon]